MPSFFKNPLCWFSFCLISAILFYFGAQKTTSLTSDSQFITLVNPVRTITNPKNPAESLHAQYQIVKSQKLKATWLFSFDAISDKKVLQVIQGMNKTQELGILLEVSPALAASADVSYNREDSWHRANSVFLSGYTQKDRQKLIDKVFEEFQQELGLTPTSVGAWWVDSFSIAYMKEKYGITAVLGVADQFQTDGYQVWGQYWSTPFYPSRYHAAVPASEKEAKLDVVIMQWASRDPLWGYGGGVEESTYSVQDYLLHKLDLDYFEKLLRLYGEKHDNAFGHVTLGLEADLPPDFYSDIFDDHLTLIRKLQDGGQFAVVTMKEFSSWYRTKFPNLSPPHTIAPADLLGSEKRAIWYQSPRYRIGLTSEKEGVRIVDFRTYHKDLEEPYYGRPNRQIELSIYVPSLIDKASVENNFWQIDSLPINEIVTKDGVTTITSGSGATIIFSPERIEFYGLRGEIPRTLREAKTLKLEGYGAKTVLNPQKSWFSSLGGETIKALTPAASHFIAQRKIILFLAMSFLAVLLFLLAVTKTRVKRTYKVLLIGTIIIGILGGGSWWILKNQKTYYIGQEEIDGLFHLSTEPVGQVLVPDEECLQCLWNSRYQPIVFTNQRGYVQSYSGHKVIKNEKFFNARSPDEAKRELAKSGAAYIYLVGYEDYLERLPYLAGDLGLTKLYQNAGAVIWKTEDGR